MSKELVARALRALDPYGQGDSTANLIRAVDAQYPTGWDEEGGFYIPGFGVADPELCCDWCLGYQSNGHAENCQANNTRVALLALCRDILGEKG